uniref:Uncharacterized protein n=1 Tax=Rhizophora mucronata TaxID=61149 RepID=A0A2P2PBC1_RHIMU
MGLFCGFKKCGSFEIIMYGPVSGEFLFFFWAESSNFVKVNFFPLLHCMFYLCPLLEFMENKVICFLIFEF